MLITKADGENIAASQRAQGDYMNALHLFPPRESGWVPRVLAVSAAEHKGIEEAWQMISDHSIWMKERGLFEAHRRQQDVQWFSDAVQGMLFDLLARDAQWVSAKKRLESEVQSGGRNPFDAADELLQLARQRLH
jgi:LAO/AO transport system kinase